ncbi:hypothetical protein NDU88_002448 [Pleurodeles waltl]|uniref:Uncharacterized protein n=1 Tax=Pleurodeles waltl TaxID=8319 RepID=A0AAV7L3L8_PLEWA|nr:hypothetical protein NDU88_002448 [Pleurodeles waltl]
MAVFTPPSASLFADAMDRAQAIYGRPDPQCSLALMHLPRSRLTELSHCDLSAHLLCRGDLPALYQAPSAHPLLLRAKWGGAELCQPSRLSRRPLHLPPLFPERPGLQQHPLPPAPDVPGRSVHRWQPAHTSYSLQMARVRHFVQPRHLSCRVLDSAAPHLRRLLSSVLQSLCSPAPCRMTRSHVKPGAVPGSTG